MDRAIKMRPAKENRRPEMLTLHATFSRITKAANGAAGRYATSLYVTGAALGILAAGLLTASILASKAEARHWRGHRHARFYAHHHDSRWHHASLRYRFGHSHGTPHIAAIVIDGNSGRTLYASNENEPWFPASITKVMTLYLLFEQLEKGRLGLDSEIRVSSYAASQKPTKLGLRPGQMIAIDDAIKAVVTRSANDIAVAIAEAIGGDEERFADLMTRKAHALGMSDTHFANASGLPDPGQRTTAHDLAILGRAIQERFPRYYHYFSTHVFHYGRQAIANHNHLLERVEGMDGIKTGYTRASGFNLLTSVKRDGHYIVAVVLGGSSAGARDRIMADLIEDKIGESATIRTAALISETNGPAHMADRPERQDQGPRGNDSTARNDPVLAYAPSPPRETRDFDPIRLAAFNPAIPEIKARPAYISAASKQDPASSRPPLGESSRKQGSPDGSTTRGSTEKSGAPATPSALSTPPNNRSTDRIAAAIESSPYGSLVKVANAKPAAQRNGWIIQIGATSDVSKAAELLVRAKTESHQILSGAQPYTEKVQKGSETLYRARFAGLEADSAERACKTLKLSGFNCFATRN